MGFGIFIAIFRHLFQDGHHMTFQHRKFEYQRRIEHDIGILLKRENPFVFPFSYTAPTSDGITGRITPVMVIANDAPQQSGVGCWYPVMLINGNSGKCRYINLEQSFGRDSFGQFRIQSVDTFQYEECIFFQFKFFAFEVSFAGFEVKKRQFNLLSGH